MVAQKREAETVVESRKLDYELLERWIKYMEKPPEKYHHKEACQAMMKLATAAPPGEGRGGRGAAATLKSSVWRIDHTKLTYRYSGRDFRLTDVAGNVLHELVA